MAARPLLAALSLLLASGCALPSGAGRPPPCDPDAAFADGVNDAVAGRELARAAPDGCDTEATAGARRAYRDGYLEGLARRPAPPPEPGRGWTCEVTAFGQRYLAVGPTEAEAAARTRAACQATNHEMHCTDLACRPGK